MKQLTRIIILVLGMACLTWATTIRPMSVDRLTKLSSTIVEAHATQTWSEWNPEHTQIYTYTRLTVTRNFKGPQADSVLVKQIGGTVGQIKEVVYGVRHFRAGDDAFLFLEPSAENDGTMRVVGLMQGNFLIYRLASGELKASNGVPNVTVRSDNGQLAPYTGSQISVNELETRVTKAVSQ